MAGERERTDRHSSSDSPVLLVPQGSLACGSTFLDDQLLGKERKRQGSAKLSYKQQLRFLRITGKIGKILFSELAQCAIE